MIWTRDHATSAATLDIAILGPLRILQDGSETSLTRTQALALLVLVCAGGHPVTKDALHRKVYGREPDMRSAQTLRRHIANLRAAIGPQAVKTTSLAEVTAYRLDLSGVRLDADRFRELAQAGMAALRGRRLVDAAALTGEAIVLWRGRPLPELPGHGFASGLVSNLESWHQNTARVRAEALIRLTRHREIIPELQSFTRAYPGDGLLWRLLAIALYADHHDGGASEALQDASKAFVGEGLHPGYFRSLHEQVLNMTLPRDGAMAIDTAARPGTPPSPLL
jgi:DNA-binding SARP family transcriptional activator